MSQFDIAFVGTGAAALSLAYRLAIAGYKGNVLLIDKEKKDLNDRTWCYWEADDSVFEEIVYRKWRSGQIITDTKILNLSFEPYTYKMIRAVDYYAFTKKKLTNHTNFQFVQTYIGDIKKVSGGYEIACAERTYSARQVFNSIWQQPAVQNDIWLWQHFGGWLIHTEVPAFDPDVPTIMDFTASQGYGTGFYYILPLDSQRALIEFTVFGQQLIQHEEYEKEIKRWLTDNNIGAYRIEEKEFGRIPMTNFKMPQRQPNGVVNIGTAGGLTKPSTGYTFSFIQKDAAWLADTIMRRGIVRKRPSRPLKYTVFDDTLLQVLHEKGSGKEFFTRLFEKNKPQDVFAFLSEHSHLSTDLRIMNSMPIGTFTAPFFNSLFKHILG